MKKVLLALLLATGFLLTGCGRGSKQDVLKKAENVSTKAELEKTLGKPDNVDKLLGLERWTYNASDGPVNFNIAGDTVMLSDTVGKEKK